MPKLTDKIIREAVEEFDKEYKYILRPSTHSGVISHVICHEDIKSFLEAKLRQMAEEVKERLTIDNYHRDNIQETCACSGCAIIDDLEELKKTI